MKNLHPVLVFDETLRFTPEKICKTKTVSWRVSMQCLNMQIKPFDDYIDLIKLHIDQTRRTLVINSAFTSMSNILMFTFSSLSSKFRIRES